MRNETSTNKYKLKDFIIISYSCFPEYIVRIPKLWALIAFNRAWIYNWSQRNISLLHMLLVDLKEMFFFFCATNVPWLIQISLINQGMLQSCKNWSRHSWSLIYGTLKNPTSPKQLSDPTNLHSPELQIWWRKWLIFDQIKVWSSLLHEDKLEIQFLR